VASTRCFTLTWSSLLGKLDRFVNMSCKYGTDLTTSQSLPGIPISRRRLIAPPHTAESSHRLLTADSSPPTPHRPLLDAHSSPPTPHCLTADSSLPTPRRRLLSALADTEPRTLPESDPLRVPSLTSLSSRSSSAPRSSSPLPPPRTLRHISTHPHPNPRSAPNPIALRETTSRVGSDRILDVLKPPRTAGTDVTARNSLTRHVHPERR
jgi:hypothetical protein